MTAPSGRPPTPTRRQSTEAMFPSPFPEPRTAPLLRFPFAKADLPALREAVGHTARGVGLDPARLPDFVLAAHELAANSVLHGGGAGLLRLWIEAEELICEVSDHGELAEPEAAGHTRPNLSATGGAGLWIVRQAADAMEARSEPGQGTSVRMWMRLSGAARPVPGAVGS